MVGRSLYSSISLSLSLAANYALPLFICKVTRYHIIVTCQCTCRDGGSGLEKIVMAISGLCRDIEVGASPHSVVPPPPLPPPLLWLPNCLCT